MSLPTRKTQRLQNYNYASYGIYFVTICTYEHRNLFWSDTPCVLNGAGEMLVGWIKELSKEYPCLHTDCYAVMPNHVHLILFLHREGEASMPEMLDWFKTMTSNDYICGVKAGAYAPFHKRVWQRGYYDHVVRNGMDLDATRDYVMNNPVKWKLDKLYG